MIFSGKHYTYNIHVNELQNFVLALTIYGRGVDTISHPLKKH